MSIKVDIGSRIREERERLGMSRDVFCMDGQDLTVRQLIRIEKGESLPSLDRLEFISERLGTTMSDLLKQDRVVIPDEYYEMKNRLIKFPTYRDEKRIAEKLSLIEEIYDKFFEVLPEEELLTLDILEHILSFSELGSNPSVKEIYEDLFTQTQKKKIFALNDLLVIDYYFFTIHNKKHFEKQLFDKLVRKLVSQEVSKDESYNITRGAS